MVVFLPLNPVEPFILLLPMVSEDDVLWVIATALVRHIARCRRTVDVDLAREAKTQRHRLSYLH